MYNRYPRFRIISKTVIGIIALLFVDSLREMYSVHWVTQPPERLGIEKEAQINLDLVSSQRNAFLCGFSVFLFLLLYRFQSMVDKIVQLEKVLATRDERIPKKFEPHLRRDSNLGGQRERVELEDFQREVRDDESRRRAPLVTSMLESQ